MPPEAAKIIESLQPYNTPNPTDVKIHLLWRLNKLCNIDKHTRIPVHGLTGIVKWDTFIPLPLPPEFPLPHGLRIKGTADQSIHRTTNICLSANRTNQRR